jgi:PAS domain S-box-containing protein
MIKTKIIFRLILIFLFFAVMVVLPLTFTIVKQVDKMIAEEEGLYMPGTEAFMRPHREFTSRLIGHIVPYTFYILIMTLLLSIFFMRKMLISLKELQAGSHAVKEGNLDVSLEIISDDELGDVTKAFNEMTAALKEKTLELQKKDIYINAMLDPLWVVDENNTILDVNPAFERLLGHRREDVIGASIYDFFDERNAMILRRQLEEKREKGISSIYEISIFRKDGSQMPVLISGSPIYAGDEIVGKIGIFKDFTEQEELKQALQQAKEYAETIMDSIEDELLVIDREYRIIKANKIAMMNTGENIIGRFCHMISHNSQRPCMEDGHECPAQAVFITGKNWRTTHKHVNQAGEVRYHEIVASPITDSSGNVVSVIELLRDVTERMKHEEEISKKNRELTVLNSISGILSRSLKPDEILTKILDKLMEMLNMDGGEIFFLDEGKKEMTCQYQRGISDEYVKTMGRIRLGEDIPGKVAVTGQLVTSADITKDYRVERSLVRHLGIKGYCCIPIKGKERILGVLCLFSFRPHFFSMEEENILTSIGEMTGIALENVKLYEKMLELYEYQRKRREEEYAQLLSLSTKLGSAIDLKEIMGNILELIKSFFRADFVWMLVNDSEGNLLLKKAANFRAKEGDIIYPKDISSAEGYSIDKKTTIVIPDIRAEERFYLHPEISAVSYHTAASVPMFIGDKSVGAFTLYYLGSRVIKAEEIHFLEIIANILAVSLERSDLYIKSIADKGRSETVLQNVADGIITVDNTGRVISVNKAFEKMSGFPAVRAEGLSVCDVFRYAEDNIRLRFLLGECLDAALSGRQAVREAELITIYGQNMPVQISSNPVYDAAGNVISAVNLFRDISSEKEIDRMKTDLIRSVSHEFRTPLSAIVGMTEMILEGDISDIQTRKYLNTILSEGIRLSSMVSDLLSIARIESGKEILKSGPVVINEILKTVIESFTSIIDKKKASVELDISLDEVFLGDEEKIKQILMNFLDNSLTFSDEGCKIIISAGKKDDNIEIMISDNGWGIPEEDLPHLTERFYRGKHGERIKGTGLGLSLCNEIVKMHKGTMDIKSRVGEGTEITVTFPYREAK